MSKASPLRELNGIIPSLHTPFNKDKSIDYKSLKKLIFHTIQTNCAGMLVTAVAGETQSLTFKEKSEFGSVQTSPCKPQIPIEGETFKKIPLPFSKIKSSDRR